MLGLIFFYKYISDSIDDEVLVYEETKFKQLIDIVPNMSELKCSRFGIEQEWCIDYFKAKSFSSVGGSYYEDMLRGKGLKLFVEELEDVSLWGDEGSRKYTIPVSVYNPGDKKYYMARLEVSWNG